MVLKIWMFKNHRFWTISNQVNPTLNILEIRRLSPHSVNFGGRQFASWKKYLFRSGRQFASSEFFTQGTPDEDGGTDRYIVILP
jgi:hypothetical protein